MALISWNDNLSVHVGEIDRQHQQLIKMINDLDDAMKQGKGKEVLGKIVKGLSDYTAYHFSTEEKYFSQFGYPAAEVHIREHRTFVDKVTDFKKKFETNRIGLSTDVINFLSDWLKNHIQVTDHKYGPFLKEKGLK
ncbi:MAG TPA: bacteriohemerythrin [Desulfomonilia bacterium]|nr:bacteriohemerythrin [Desulfomonilia bacterium]